MSKYGNKRVVTPDGVFDSQAEFSRWIELVGMERAGAIFDLARQKPFILSDKPRCVYTPDFLYVEPLADSLRPLLVAEDVKGHAARDVFVRVCWLLQRYDGPLVVRLLRRPGRREVVKRGWRLDGGWLVREYAQSGTAKRRRRAA